MHQTNEQRNYQLKVKELRSKWKKPSGDGNESDSCGEPPGIEKDRQPRLTDLTPDYDLKLFMEAQALASEKIVSFSLKPQPNKVPTSFFFIRQISTNRFQIIREKKIYIYPGVFSRKNREISEKKINTIWRAKKSSIFLRNSTEQSSSLIFPFA